ncbi:hypothetical protein [Blastococcus sp. TF02A-26]|nr:hypothetical protein [Blastococcus sp. TF02A-26]
MSHRPQVMLVCVNNAGRSRMAAGLMEHACAWSTTTPPAASLR